MQLITTIGQLENNRHYWLRDKDFSTRAIPFVCRYSANTGGGFFGKLRGHTVHDTIKHYSIVGSIVRPTNDDFLGKINETETCT